MELVVAFKEALPDTRLHITHENYIGGWDALYHNRCQLVIGAPVTIPDEINENGAFAWKNMGELHWSLVIGHWSLVIGHVSLSSAGTERKFDAYSG